MEFIRLLIVFLTVLPETLPDSNESDWFSAQEICRNQGKQLTTNSSASTECYWTGKHKRYSQWISILGCYGDKDVKDKTVQTFNMEEDASIGLCQEYCLNRKSTIYAVKKRECRCLQNYIAATSKSPSSCNYRCTNEEDTILSNECGGNATYNVFSTTQDAGHGDEERCVSLACRHGNATLEIRDCSDPLKMLCNSTEITPSKKKWRESLKECISSYGLYAKGHTNVSETSLSCQTIQQEKAWIGIVRERYISQDRGHAILDRHLYLKCQKCEPSDCAYEKCSEEIKTHVICSFAATSEQESTSVYNFDDDSINEKTAEGAIAIFFAVALMVIGFTVILYLCFRSNGVFFKAIPLHVPSVPFEVK